MAGVINKIRSKGAIVVTIVGVALASFILSDLFQNAWRVYQGEDTPDVLAKVGDKRIKADEFKFRIDQQEYLAQMNGQPADREQITGQVWDQIINEIIYDKEFEKLGIKVTDAEFKDMVSGPQPDPTAMSIFQNADNMRSVLQQAEKDPNMKFRLQMAERYLIRNRMTTKYNNLLRNGLMVSKAEAKRKKAEESMTANIEYVAVSYSSLADKDFKPTDADYNEVYNQYKEEFRQRNPEAIINYVAIPKSATKRDTMAGYKYLNDLAADFKKSTDDSSYAAGRNRSAQRFDFVYKNRSELDPKEAEILGNAKKDSVYGPILSGKVLKLIKVNNIQKNDTAPFVKIRHILLQPKSPGDTTQAYMDFQALKATVTKENFAMKVMEKSDDQRSKMMGGDLGWYRWGMFGTNTELDKKLKKATKGQIFGAKSAAGYHIVEVLDRSTDGIRLATIGYDMEPGKETMDSLMTIAERLRLEAGNDTAKFNNLAKAKKLVTKQSQPITPGSNFIDGMAGGTIKGLVSWALMKDAGDLFDRTYDSDNMILTGYLVSKVEEGYKPMALVKAQLKDRVMARLKAKKIKEKLAAAAKGKSDMTQIQTAYGSGAFSNTADGVSFASGFITGIGQDPFLVGKIFGLKPNQVSAPIVGKGGVYVVKVISFGEVPATDDKAIEEYRISLQQNRRASFIGKFQQGLREYAQVKDYRFKHGY
jgi:peptidyl-prolyl cis-trans isomerase D